MKRLALLLLLASPLYGQSFTRPLTDQTVIIGTTATFTATVSNGPCRSYWLIGGVGHYGAVDSTFTWTFPNAQLTDSGTSVQLRVYQCLGGTIGLTSSTVHLTVNPASKPSTFSFPAQLFNCTKCDGSDDSKSNLGLFAGATISISQDGISVCGGAIDTSGHFNCTGPVDLAPVTVNLSMSIRDPSGQKIIQSFGNNVDGMLMQGRTIINMILRLDAATVTPRGLAVWTT